MLRVILALGEVLQTTPGVGSIEFNRLILRFVMKGKSFPIAIANVMVLLVVVFFGEVEGEIPGWIEFVLYPFFVYWSFSVFISFGGVVVGLKELRAPVDRFFVWAGVVGNSVYFVGAVVAIGKLWPALMGI